MKVSRLWLQKYFDAPLPNVGKIGDALTFHAFEIDSIEGDVLDVKVLPNRAADCLSHRGIAKELSAILAMPVKSDSLRASLKTFPNTDALSVHIEDGAKCLRYMGGLVKGVKVGPSPAWLREALESVGQRSINNVVDATNYVMLNIGQPLHAFDAANLKEETGKYAIQVRTARSGEKMQTLSGEEYLLPKDTLLITDAHADLAIGIAGIKGGKAAGITEATVDIIVESANFDGSSIRKSAQALKLFTDASARFQNRPSPELAAYGMQEVLMLIQEITSGEVVGVTDVYKVKPETKTVSVTLSHINSLLGSNFSKEEVSNIFRRLDLSVEVSSKTFAVTPPFERIDLIIAEDLIEEVGRSIGYDKILPVELRPTTTPADQSRFRGIERMKDSLVEQGFTEISTQSFAKKGDITLANPLDIAKPALRTSLEDNLKEALERAKYHAPLVLGPNQKPKLFEVGTVFPKEGEFIALQMSERVPAWGESVGTFDNLSKAKLEDYGKEYVPVVPTLGAYKPFSIYPFILRDIALWVPSGTKAEVVEGIIRENAGPLLVRLDIFDEFEKEGRTSFAFRMVFESMERTLTDEEVNKSMEKITSVLEAQKYQVR